MTYSNIEWKESIKNENKTGRNKLNQNANMSEGKKKS